MKAMVKEIYSLELTSRLEDYHPEDDLNFAISVRMMIGPTNSGGSESFDLLVCTPNWIDGRCESDGAIWGRHMLIVSRYNWPMIKKKIDSFVDGCFGNDWPEIAQKLSSIASWEFDDYQS